MTETTRSPIRAVVLGSAGVLFLGAAIGACTDALGAGARQDVSLSFGVTQNGALVNATAGSLAAIIVEGGGHTVDLTSADVVFSDITFEGRNTTADDDDDSDNETDSDSDNDADGSDSDSDSDARGSNSRFRAGAATVSLPLEGGVVTPFTGQIPVGTYRSVEMDADFLRIRGTYDGQAFDVTVPINADLELLFQPPLEVTESSTPVNVSVNIDVSNWFKDASGTVIDPRLLATNTEMRAQFRNRVRASFKAFEDEDKDADESDSDSDSDG